MNDKRWWTLLALIVIFTMARIAATHRVFSATIDEPAHLIAGYNLLTRGDYTTDLAHPPLAKALFALPFLNTPAVRADDLLFRNDRYTQNLARMRMGNLLFVAIGILAVALWARHLLSPAAGLVAALLFASLPPILAHGGLATTDMAIAAMLPLALYALTLLLEKPAWPRTLFLAAAIAAGVLTKYSFLVFFPACAVVLIARHRRFPIAHLLVAGALALLVIWAVFGFSLSPMIAGIRNVQALEHDPPKAILFEHVRKGGWWYYFPVALFFKTPIPFLILALIGSARQRTLAVMAALILAIAMTSSINIGVRHVLPIYAPLSIAAASTRIRFVTIALTAWLMIGSLLAHPDYLPYFNAFAGREPHRVLNDSNLDWGQDVLRLVRLARREKIAAITTSIAANTSLDRVGLPPRTELQALQPVHGYLAISEFNIALGRDISPELRDWLDGLLRGRPYRRVGASIRLYDFSSPTPAPAPSTTRSAPSPSP